MNKNNFFITALLFCLILISGCASKKKVVQPKPKVPSEVKNEIPEIEQPTKEIEDIELVRNPTKIAPYVMREFRAAWIATVANINWPSKSGLSTKQQQEEAIKLLDFLKKHNYNAFYFLLSLVFYQTQLN